MERRKLRDFNRIPDEEDMHKKVKRLTSFRVSL
jgi:hypothetical protein